MSSNSDTLKTYNDHFDRYIAGTVQQVSGDVFQGKWLDDVLRNLHTDDRILEIGSAFGRDASYIQQQGYTLEITDAFDAAVDYLNAHGFAARKLNILTDKLDGKYGAIIACAVFLHFTKQELMSVLEKCSRHISETGTVAFSLKKGDGESWSTEKMDAPRYFHYWQPEQVREIVNEIGLKIIDERMSNDEKWLHYMVGINHGN